MKEATYIEQVDNIHSDIQQVLRDLAGLFNRLREHQINGDSERHLNEHVFIESGFEDLGGLIERSLLLFFQRYTKLDIEAVTHEMERLEKEFKKLERKRNRGK